MGILEALHEERKARLNRINQAALKPEPKSIGAPEALTVESINIPFGSFDIIVHEICAYYGSRIEDIFSGRRHHPLPFHRAMIAYMTYLLTPLTNPQIAVKMNRDPTSIWHGISRIKTNLNNHLDVIQELEQRIRPLLEERGRRVKTK